VDTTPGYLRVGRRLVRDIHDYGLIDVTQVVVKSSNVGVSKIALSLPAEQLWNLYARLGFGKITGVGLAGERSGVLRHFSSWSLIGHANHAFGYGLSVTTLQLAQAYAVLASDGIRRPLSLLRLDKPPKETVRLLSVNTTRQLRSMLEAVISREGTGLKALVSGYRVAGKTGTIRKIVGGQYTRNHYISLFAGMAPASQPRLVVVVMIDDPKRGGYYGGTVAAPVFSSIMGGALRVLNVTPDALTVSSFAMTVTQDQQR
jgi:cell division protein FtsI (penicillin-binding protein 3)